MFRRKGVWWTCIRHNGRKVQKSLETPDRKLAQAIEAKIRAELVEGKFFERELGRDRNFRGMMKKFMEEHSPKVTVNMQKSYTNSLKHLTAFFGNFNLNEITKERLSDYKAKRLMDGIAPASLYRELGMIGKALNLAIEWNWLKEAPRVKREKEDNARVRWLRSEEEERLLAACQDLDLHWLKEAVILDINTGLRLGELLALEWPEVNLFQKTLFVKESKNKESRTVPLNEAAMAILISKSKIRNIASKLVFPNPAGNIWDQCNLGKVFRGALKKAEIEDFRFHDLRHTFGSRLAQAGVDINTIARLMGHRDLKMTQRYIHHTVDSLRKGVEKLNSDYILTTLNKKGVNLSVENIG